MSENLKTDFCFLAESINPRGMYLFLEGELLRTTEDPDKAQKFKTETECADFIEGWEFGSDYEPVEHGFYQKDQN